MGKFLFTLSSGFALGFAFGIFLDDKKRKEIQKLAKTQGERLKSYEQTLKRSIEKLSNVKVKNR